MEERDKQKNLLALRKWLVKQINKRERELIRLRRYLETVNFILLESSFVSADSLIKPKQAKRRKGITILKSKSGLELGELNWTDDGFIFKPTESIEVITSSPPFSTFFISTLEDMKREDEERVSRGELSPDRAFTYRLDEEENVLKEIVVSNLRDRKREILSKLRWTIERYI